jgi:hypothetical protein
MNGYRPARPAPRDIKVFPARVEAERVTAVQRGFAAYDRALPKRLSEVQMRFG